MQASKQIITSTANEKVRLLKKLRSRSGREEAGLFIVDGLREAEAALAAGSRPTGVFFCPEMADADSLGGVVEKARASGAEIVRCSRRVMEKIAYGERACGLLLVCPLSRKRLADLAPADPPLLVVVESVEKPGNLGAVIRSVDAAGADGVIVCDPAVDVFNPNVIRASAGLVFSVPVVEASTPETLQWLKARGIKALAAAPSADMDYTAADMRGPAALVAGTEATGLSGQWLKESDARISIKMRGKGDSLNVSAAVSVILFEAARQRGQAGET